VKLENYTSFLLFITCIACLLITVVQGSKCSYFYIITPTSFAYADSSEQIAVKLWRDREGTSNVNNTRNCSREARIRGQARGENKRRKIKFKELLGIHG
jgi:hypothetical protein